MNLLRRERSGTDAAIADALARQWDGAALAVRRAANLAEVLAAARTTRRYRRLPPGDVPLADLPITRSAEIRTRPGDFVTTRRDEVIPSWSSATSGRRAFLAKPVTARSAVRDTEFRGYDSLGLHPPLRLMVVRPWPGGRTSWREFHHPRVRLCEIGLDQALRDAGRSDVVWNAQPDVLARLAEFPGRRRPALASFELLTERTRTALAAAGIPVADTYNCSEVTTEIALRGPDCTALHGHEDVVAMEILGPDQQPSPPGVAGRVVLSDLVNTAMSVLRLDIGDVAVAASCACGRAGKAVRLLGRTASGIDAAELYRSLDMTASTPLIAEVRRRALARRLLPGEPDTCADASCRGHGGRPVRRVVGRGARRSGAGPRHPDGAGPARARTSRNNGRICRTGW